MNPNRKQEKADAVPATTGTIGHAAPRIPAPRGLGPLLAPQSGKSRASATTEGLSVAPARILGKPQSPPSSAPFIRDHVLAPVAGEQSFRLGRVMLLSRRQREPQRVAQAVHAHMDLRAVPAATAAQGLR